MSSAIVSVTDVAALTVLRNFLLTIVPAGVEVVRAQINRVPEPTAADFVKMTPLFRRRLATNLTSYDDSPGLGIRYDVQSTEYTVQLDVHGPNAGDNMQIITTLFRSDFAVTNFGQNILTENPLQNLFGAVLTTQDGAPVLTTSSVDITPLYCNEARQMPFIDGEQQFENRWTADAVMQINPVITTTQDFAAALQIGIFEVDAHYPP